MQLIAAAFGGLFAWILPSNPVVQRPGILRPACARRVVVASGLLSDDCQRINEAFANYIHRHTPLVTLKTAMTLDGKIAPPPGESENPTALGSGSVSGGWITSEVARAHVQELRHQNDAILVGVGTIIATISAHRSQRLSPAAPFAACCRRLAIATAVGIACCKHRP